MISQTVSKDWALPADQQNDVASQHRAGYLPWMGDQTHSFASGIARHEGVWPGRMARIDLLP